LKSRIDTRNESASAGERGWALVSVLWIVTAIALIAAATESLTATSYTFERRSLARAKAEAALDAGITEAMLGIEAPDIADRWRIDGSPREVEFNGITLKISVQDEVGKFDLNLVDGPTLTALLRSQSVGQGEAAILTGRVLDWRTAPEGDAKQLNGGSDTDYSTAGLSYRPRHGPFQSVDELQLVLGMTPDLFARIRPALTVYTKKLTINPNVAPREALLALYNGNSLKVEQILRARKSDSAAPGVTLDTATDPSGQAFTIAVEMDFERHHYARTVVAMLTGDGPRPYLILAWR
jgi:general secretion pathway protein K